MPFEQPTLQLGDSGAEVMRLQEDLTAVGCFTDEADGSFGESTAGAVMQFQEAVGLFTDGVVNQDTWSILEGPEATIEDSIDLSDFPAMALAASHASDPDLTAYLSELGIAAVGGEAEPQSGEGEV